MANQDDVALEAPRGILARGGGPSASLLLPLQGLPWPLT